MIHPCPNCGQPTSDNQLLELEPFGALCGALDVEPVAVEALLLHPDVKRSALPSGDFVAAALVRLNDLQAAGLVGQTPLATDRKGVRRRNRS